MNEDLLEKATVANVSRRTVVKTGVKLAYAAPLIAATMRMADAGIAAAASGGNTQGGGTCFHSYKGGPLAAAGSCKDVCAGKCPGAGGACEDACEVDCPIGSAHLGDNNVCRDGSPACDPNAYTCAPDHAVIYKGVLYPKP